MFLFQVADLKNKLETEKGKDAYPKSNVRLIYAGRYINYTINVQFNEVDNKEKLPFFWWSAFLGC